MGGIQIMMSVSRPVIHAKRTNVEIKNACTYDFLISILHIMLLFSLVVFHRLMSQQMEFRKYRIFMVRNDFH